MEVECQPDDVLWVGLVLMTGNLQKFSTSFTLRDNESSKVLSEAG